MNKTKFFSSMLVVALFATASVLTSCKDYDDDIKNLQQQIDAKSAKAELESLQSTLQTQLSSVQSSLDTKIANLNTAIANKADASTVTALASSVQDLTATVAALQTQLSSVNSALADYAKTSDVEALNTKYVALTGDVSTLKGDVEGLKSETALLKAADENLKQQITALQNLSTALDQLKTKVANLEANGYDDTELKNAIAALQTKLADYDALKSDVATLKNVMQIMSEEVNKVKSQVNVLNVFVNKRLTSMILMPNFYWEGLEAIEVPFAYTPEFKEQAKDYTFTYTQQSALGNQNIAVTVKSYMTAALTDGQTVNLETATANNGPWTALAGPKSLTEANIRALVVLQGLTNKKTGAAYTAANAPLSFVELSQGGVAKYHISPTTADLEGMKVGFFENDAEVYTRAAGAIAATPFETTISKDNQYNKFENGVLTVPFKVDGPKLKSMFTAWTNTNLAANDPNWDTATGKDDGKGTLGTPADKKSAPLPFLAGQLTSADNDTTVTSDYAVLVPADITIIALADKDPLAQIDGKATKFSKNHTTQSIRDNHLYESVGYNGITIPASAEGNNYGAITMPATHEIVYTDKSFDLKQYVQTHAAYTTYAKYGRSTQDAALSEAELAALGLHYEFNIITYLKGVETTSQSAHLIAVDAEGKPTTDKTIGRFSVRSVDASGNTMVNEEATVETVGREPLIRVDLKNAEGKIVRYGYIKLRIAKSAANNEEVTVDFGDIYMNCGGKGKMTWAQVENLILRKINMTKEEFEQNYYLDVVGGHTAMPKVNAAPQGGLYQNAKTNNWMARRFYKDGGTYKVAALPTGANENTWSDDNMTQMAKYTATSNWFGRVWYTPHDNSMGGQNWDENTNVLEWNFGEDFTANPPAITGTVADASNMNKAAYTKMIEVAGATYKNKGLNQNAISTVVRFVNKNNGTYIYVTLKFEVGKIHFAYADINRRVLDHWYDVADGYKDNTADTIEVYANVPTPAILGSNVTNVTNTGKYLTPNNVDLTNFTKDLKEYWLNQQIVVDIYNPTKFGKFTAAGNTTTSFEFRIPVKGTSTSDQVEVKGSNGVKLYVNSYSTDYKIKYKADGKTVDYYYWQAKGASGKTYNLFLATAPAGAERTTAANPANRVGTAIFGNQIVAELGNNKYEVVATITADGIIHYNGYKEQNVTPETTAALLPVNSAASDILNYVGMYDNKGNLLKDSYLDGQDATKDRAFTAFINIKVTNDVCYDPLIGKNTFNVRFLRPVNMWPAETEWTDAPNATQIYPIWKLVYIRDWRQYAVVPLNETQQFGKTAVSGTGLDGKNHKGDFAEGNVPYQFYGIENLYIKRDEIRSDAHKAPADRVIKTNAADIIANTLPITSIPSLTGTNAQAGGATWQFLKIFAWNTDEATTATAAGAAATGLPESTAWNNVLAYTNNGGVVKTFHVYVPISLKYPWGGLTDWTQKVWAVITINPTQGND